MGISITVYFLLLLLCWLFGGGGGYTGCLSPVYLDSQSVGSEWYINHRCPKTVQVEMTVDQKQTSQQWHLIRNGIYQSVHTGRQFLMLSVHCLSIYSIMSNTDPSLQFNFPHCTSAGYCLFNFIPRNDCTVLCVQKYHCC